MSEKKSLNRTISIFQAVLTALLLVSVFLIYLLYDNTVSLKKLEAEKFTLTNKAQELHSSSQTLTLLARQYVVTEMVEYKNDFYQAINMRSGFTARPEYRPTTYWQLLEPVRSQRHPAQYKQNLKDILFKLPYTQQERQFLVDSENNVNETIEIEIEAFKSIEGFEVSESGFWKTKKPNKEKAISLLFSKEYSRAVHDITLPLDKLMTSLNDRMKKNKNILLDRHSMLIDLLPIAFIVIFILLLMLFKMIRTRITFYYSRLEHLSFIDHLTKAYNRRYLFEVGNKFMSLNQRHSAEVGVILIDIDHFKNINDQHGHTSGDNVLIKVADQIRCKTRQSDLFFRYGGEEFLVLVRIDDLVSLEKLSDKIRKSIADLIIYHDEEKTLSCTISVGAAMEPEVEALEDLIKCADQALYQAKEQGRNKTIIYNSSDFVI